MAPVGPQIQSYLKFHHPMDQFCEPKLLHFILKNLQPRLLTNPETLPTVTSSKETSSITPFPNTSLRA